MYLSTSRYNDILASLLRFYKIHVIVVLYIFFIKANYTIKQSSITFLNIVSLYRNKIHFYQIHTRRHYYLPSAFRHI